MYRYIFTDYYIIIIIYRNNHIIYLHITTIHRLILLFCYKVFLTQIYFRQAQSETEARVAQVASELRRLQEAEGKMNRASESRSGGAPDRVAHLEEQLTLLTQQRLQHLERIQDQQLDLQVKVFHFLK